MIMFDSALVLVKALMYATCLKRVRTMTAVVTNAVL
jgi:hypothetical protein